MDKVDKPVQRPILRCGDPLPDSLPNFEELRPKDFAGHGHLIINQLNIREELAGLGKGGSILRMPQSLLRDDLQVFQQLRRPCANAFDEVQAHPGASLTFSSDTLSWKHQIGQGGLLREQTSQLFRQRGYLMQLFFCFGITPYFLPKM